MSKVYLGLGSNIGDKINYLDQAVVNLKSHPQIRLVQISSYYETAPVSYLNQDHFINQVVELETTLPPYELLAHCQQIENRLGRKREIKFGPRTIDLDILLYDDLKLNDELLIIPHPRMTIRAFVLIPLAEIAKNIQIEGRTVHELISAINQYEVRKLIR